MCNGENESSLFAMGNAILNRPAGIENGILHSCGVELYILHVILFNSHGIQKVMLNIHLSKGRLVLNMRVQWRNPLVAKHGE